jgi:Fe-S-cluster containining protein
MIKMTETTRTESSHVQERSEPQITAGNGEHLELLEELRQEVTRGFLYANTRANHNTGKALQVASFCYALIELLSEKGIITVEELDKRKKAVADRLVKKFKDEGMGAVYQDPECDKYNFDKEVEIDCASRVHLCKAACCRIFGFALSRQDIKEGVVRWDLGHPYMISKDGNGCCTHLDRATYRCTVREHRPIPCRAFDCRNDKRIWLDFENKVINPDIGKLPESE